MENGEVTALVGQQAVIKANDKLPRMGEQIYVRSGLLGRVSDIIGRVDDPYFIVSVDKGKTVTVGEKTRSKD